MTSLSAFLAVLPFAGVIIGASLQYLFSRSAEAHKEFRKLQSETYVNYLQCVSEAPWLPAADSDAKRRFLSKLTEAKARLSVYGSAEVIDALAAFESEGAKILTPKQKQLFLKIVESMRKDGMAGPKKHRAQSIYVILMGTADA